MFSLQMQRFMDQVYHSQVNLSGFGIFKVSRGIILSVRLIYFKLKYISSFILIYFIFTVYFIARENYLFKLFFALYFQKNNVINRSSCNIQKIYSQSPWILLFPMRHGLKSHYILNICNNI